jgi:hypothetical protein
VSFLQLRFFNPRQVYLLLKLACLSYLKFRNAHSNLENINGARSNDNLPAFNGHPILSKQSLAGKINQVLAQAEEKQYHESRDDEE